MEIKRGNIFMVDLGELDGTSVEKGIRPAVVIQNDIGNAHSPTVIVAPITSKLTKHRLPTHVFMRDTALERYSIVMLEQIQTISKDRLREYVCDVPESVMRRIEWAAKISLGMKEWRQNDRDENRIAEGTSTGS